MIRTLARARYGAQVVFGELAGDAFEVHSVDHGTPARIAHGAVVPLSELELLAPVVPGKIVAIALNYRAHAIEMKKPIPEEPMFFLKPSSAVIGPGDAIRLPSQSQDVHHEGELGIVLARPLTRATPQEAKQAILGFTCVNDVTARDVQRRQNHYTRAKGYDTFCPVGPVIVQGIDPVDLQVRVRVNGELRQDGRTSDMIFGPYDLLSFVSHIMTLHPGDLVSTGTPPGVGPLHAGESVEVEIEKIGVLRNTVVAQ